MPCGLEPKLVRAFPGGSVVKDLQCKKRRLDPWVGRIRWRREWQLTSVFLPGESHEQRSLVGYNLWGVANMPW